MKSLTVFKLETTPYDEALSFQFELVERVKETKGKNSFLILLEHQPVITLGKNANRNNILASADLLKKREIQVRQTDRGGDVTYHGPGQLVGYPILHLSYHKKTVKEYVRLLEQSLIKTLKGFDVNGYIKDNKSAGVWVGESKIGFIGMRVSRGITYHGFSLNINNDLDEFNLIKPCGMDNAKITSLSELLGKEISIGNFIKEYLGVFKELFNIEIIEIKTCLSYIPAEIPM